MSLFNFQIYDLASAYGILNWKIIFTKNKMGQNMTVSKLSKLDALQSFLGILGDWSQDPRGYPNPWVLKSLK